MSKVLLTACAFGLTSVAALFLTTGTAHAEEQTWWPDCRHGWIVSKKAPKR
jgi:hypothetical protein